MKRGNMRLVIPQERVADPPHQRFGQYTNGIVTHLRMLAYAGRVPMGTAEAVYEDATRLFPGNQPKYLMGHLDQKTQEWVRFADKDLVENPNDAEGSKEILRLRPDDF